MARWTWFLLACIAWIQKQPAYGQRVCAKFSTTKCLFAPAIPVSSSRCSPSSCNFNKTVCIYPLIPSLHYSIDSHSHPPPPLPPPPPQQEDWACGFAESGLFTYTPVDPITETCEDPFMSMRRHPPAPSSSYCHSPFSSLEGGVFKPSGLVPFTTNATRYVFKPATTSECTSSTPDQADITRGQLFAYLHHHRTSILVTGDSMQRQLFERLIGMIRGQQRLLDHHIHTHARYQVCHERDLFEVASPSPEGRAGSPNSSDHLHSIIPPFFFPSQPSTTSTDTVLTIKNDKNSVQASPACSHPPHDIHFLHAPTWGRQSRGIIVYMENTQIKPIIVAAVGYWEWSVTVPQSYLDALMSAAQGAHLMVIVSVPTAKVPRVAKRAGDMSQLEVISARNEFMKKWVAERQAEERATLLVDHDSGGEGGAGVQSGKWVFLDFASMSEAENRPPLPGGPTDKHYICSIWWRGPGCKRCAPLLIGGDADAEHQFYSGVIERIQSDEGGTCTDEMQRNVWQVLLRLLLSRRTA